MRPVDKQIDHIQSQVMVYKKRDNSPEMHAKALVLAGLSLDGYDLTLVGTLEEGIAAAGPIDVDVRRDAGGAIVRERVSRPGVQATVSGLISVEGRIDSLSSKKERDLVQCLADLENYDGGVSYSASLRVLPLGTILLVETSVILRILKDTEERSVFRSESEKSFGCAVSSFTNAAKVKQLGRVVSEFNILNSGSPKGRYTVSASRAGVHLQTEAGQSLGLEQGGLKTLAGGKELSRVWENNTKSLLEAISSEGGAGYVGTVKILGEDSYCWNVQHDVAYRVEVNLNS